jgi:hypothetical protein
LGFLSNQTCCQVLCRRCVLLGVELRP